MTEENAPHNPNPHNQDPVTLDAALREFMDDQNQPETAEAEELRHHDAHNANLGQHMRTVAEELQEMQAEEAAAREAGTELTPEAKQRLSTLGIELAKLQSQLWGNAERAIDEQTTEHERDDR